MEPGNGVGSGAAQPNPGMIFAMTMAYQQTAALKTAIELDLFRAVGDGPSTAAELAKKTGASEKGVRILADYLVVHQVLAKRDGKYEHTPTSGLFLDPKSPACLAGVARFMSEQDSESPFAQLTEIVRAGRTTLAGSGSVEPDNPLWVSFAENMAPMMRPMAPFLASFALEGVTGPIKVLDIAAGHGVYGIAVAQQNPEAQVTALDWANVLKVAQRNAAEAGVADRLTLLPGSAFEVELGGPYDLVLLTNFLHHFNHATCVELLRKIYAATKKGGRVAILEMVPNEDRVSPPVPATFSMTMLATTAEGDAYTFGELSAMLAEAGFKSPALRTIPTGPCAAVLGTA